jgi:hypothetical protein
MDKLESYSKASAALHMASQIIKNGIPEDRDLAKYLSEISERYLNEAKRRIKENETTIKEIEEYARLIAES